MYKQELEVCTALTLNNHRDYIFEDNADVIATDSQKNTVYILAKQHGVSTLFLLRCNVDMEVNKVCFIITIIKSYMYYFY